nr:phage portal protein [Actinomycetospora corticicola]
MGEVDTPESAAWWMRELSEELLERRHRIEPLWQRYCGNPPLPELGNPGATKNRRDVWRAFQRKARTNYAELIVAAPLERLTPLGFRTSAAGTGETADIDARALRWWQANEMPIRSGDIIEWMLVMGTAYGIVGPPDPDDDQHPDVPVMTAEDPRFVITRHDSVRSSRVRAALKLFYDDEVRRDVAFLYLPGRVLRIERDGREGTSELGRRRFRFDARSWDVVDEQALPDGMSRTVPVVRFENRRGLGEFEAHLDHLDRINHMLLQRIVIATLQAFRQRAVKGVPKNDPKTGEPIDYSDVFTNDPAALWLLPATADMWESGQVDLTPILTSVRDDVRDLAAVTRRPVQHFIPDQANQSAEGASASRESLVYLAEDRQVRAGAGFAAMQALGFRYVADAQRSDPLTIETLWRPLERFSLTERASAAVQAQTAGVPWEARMRDFLQYEPEQIEVLRAERAEDLFYAAPAATDPQRGVPTAAATAPAVEQPRTANTDPATPPAAAQAAR